MFQWGLSRLTRRAELARILYIEASPRKLRSASIEIAKEALAQWRKIDAQVSIDILDVWATPLPEFDGAALEAKYAGLAGQPLTAAQSAAWSQIRALAERFVAA